MGLIHWWAHLAQIAPGLANSVGAAPGIAGLAKLVAGVDRHRRLPRFADRTFRRQLPDDVRIWAAPDPRNGASFSSPTRSPRDSRFTGVVALRVLQAAGFTVEVPRQPVLWRPLYDRGFLKQARRLLGQVLDAFEPELDSGCRWSSWSHRARPSSTMSFRTCSPAIRGPAAR